MRPKSLILLALAGGCGIVASIGISQVLESRGRMPAPVETARIYVALHNINLGDPIDASMVSLQEWPKDKVPPGAISQLVDLEGRRPRAAIIQGEPVLEAKLLAPGQLADPIAQIPPEMRLVTVKVDAETSAAGLLSPGDRVDVQLYVRRDTRQGIDEPRSKIILQNIRVYAVDQTVQRSADGTESRTVAKTISLLLTPKQAGKVHLAEKVGEISLIPRNPDDESLAEYDELTIDDLLGDSEKSSREKEQGRDENAEDEMNSGGGLLNAIVQAMPEKDPPFRMEIYLAGEFTEQFFDAETGEPIRVPTADPRQPLLSGGGGLGVSTPAPGSGHGAQPVPGGGGDSDMGGMDLSDFPIDLEGLE